MTFKEKKEYYQWWINEEEKGEVGDSRSFLQGMLFALQKTCTNENQENILQKMYDDYRERKKRNDRL